MTISFYIYQEIKASSLIWLTWFSNMFLVASASSEIPH